MKNLNKKKALTLVELFIAMTLMVAIVMAAFSFDLASRKFLSSSEEETVLLNELGLIVDYISRDVSRATGDFNNQGLGWQMGKLFVRVDDNNTPWNYDDDDSIQYSIGGGQIVRAGVEQPGGAPIPSHTLTTHLSDDPSPDIRVDRINGGVGISNLTLENTVNRVDYVVTLEDLYGQEALFFYPLSHSY
ncbi:MAG: hypothetical protein JW867_01145 [Candidatus Omnitrophica bacterium]|nr:hypothetical protein [Candidatus Omnitrophota bacterium]